MEEDIKEKAELIGKILDFKKETEESIKDQKIFNLFDYLYDQPVDVLKETLVILTNKK
jgi:hypothetical protein